MLADTPRIVALRHELAREERVLIQSAERAARRLVQEERVAWRRAREECVAFNCIREVASTRLEAIQRGDNERFTGECALAEMALCDADRADAAYTVISFANLTDRLRFLRGGAGGEAVLRETLERGGVYTDAYQGRHFQGIVR